MSDNGQHNTMRPDYWTTLSEYNQDEEFLSRIGEEFYPEAKPERFFENGGEESALLSPIQRRTFLKLSGFAALAAAITGCERPVQKIIPFVNQPDNLTYGVSNYYASTLGFGSSQAGVLVKTREGRPIKLEGNPDHPMNKGKLSTQAQASLMSLYDPDRLRWPARVGRKANAEYSAAATFAALDAEVGAAIKNATGKVVLLTGNVTGPSNERLIKEFKALGNNVDHVIYDPNHTTLEIEANEETFGVAAQPRYQWAKADVILCLGGDPIGQSASPEETQAGIADGRRPSAEGMSRLYVFEPAPTITGMSADYRYPVRPQHLLHIGLAIAHELIVVNGQTSYAGNGAVTALLADYSVDAVAAKTGIAADEIRRVAKSLQDNPGKTIVYTNGAAAQTAAAKDLQIVANFLNSALGAYEEVIDLNVSPSRQVQKTANTIFDLARQMNDGEVEVLIIQGVNPVYTLPPAVRFREGLDKVKTIASLSLRLDETSALADVALPGVHFLESWGDAEPQKGLYSIQQPAIRVLFGTDAADERYATRAWQESLLSLMTAAGAEKFLRAVEVEEGEEAPAPQLMSWYDFVRETWESEIAPSHRGSRSNDSFWIDVVRLGVLDTIGEEARNGRFNAPSFRLGALTGIAQPEEVSGLVLVAQPTVAHGDGTSMENPYLLELPDPVSKVCWDNYASISPSTAERLGIENGDHVTLSVDGKRVEIPAWIQPGMHPDVVSVHTGWGRNTFGAIGSDIGVNIYPLTAQGAAAAILSGIAVQVQKATGNTRLANIQGHNYLYSPELAGIMVNKAKGDLPPGMEVNEKGNKVFSRPIIGETTLNEWKKDPFHGYPNAVDPGEKLETLWIKSHKYVGHHWGMSIDLNACNGCGACIIACNIENNVPVVGKIEVLKGREMHWMRIDRYYRGDRENPDFVNQPLMCQHCDNAPCETVCPVIATMHNDEGLNVMTYNRCVGTRYCANNCPYKVRRFNFWQFADWRTGPQENIKRVSPLEMVLNPDVTTRTKGVMEKCTFCNTRIRAAKDVARTQDRQIRDGEILTACQQTCPAKAIVFGDRNDQNSAVSQDWINPRAYGLLEDLNVDPSVRYLALVRNRDEASPYRTKYQQHRLEHGHHGEHHDDHGDDHGHNH